MTSGRSVSPSDASEPQDESVVEISEKSSETASQELSGQADPLDDFRNFLYLAWEYLGLPSPTPAQYELAYQLQHGPRQQIDMCFRGFGKSWILATFCCWLLRRDQTLNILVVSASYERACDFTQFCLRLFDMEELAHLKPQEGDRQRMDRFDVHGAPVMQSANLVACGVMGSLTGKRADVVCADDCEIPNTVETQTMREKLWKRTSEFTDLLKPEGPQRVIYLGTPHSEDSIYNRLARERGFLKWIWPAQAPDERLLSVYEECLAPAVKRLMDDGLEPGHATDPQRFDDLVLAEKRGTKTPSEWALQYQLDTSLSDYLKFPLKLSDLVVMDCDTDSAPEKVVWTSAAEKRWNELPCVGLAGDHYHKPMAVVGDWQPYELKVLAVDPSGRGTDETAYKVIGVKNGYVYLLDSGGMLDGFAESTLSQLAYVAKKYQVHKVVAEANFGGGMFGQLLMPYLEKAASEDWSCAVEEVTHNRQKELRICDTLEGVVAGHKLVVDPRVIKTDFEKYGSLPDEKKGLYRLFYQMARISRDKGCLHHDDQIDSLAIAVDHILRFLGVDDDLARETKREEEFLAEMEADLEYFGQPASERGWLGDTYIGRCAA